MSEKEEIREMQEIAKMVKAEMQEIEEGVKRLKQKSGFEGAARELENEIGQLKAAERDILAEIESGTKTQAKLRNLDKELEYLEGAVEAEEKTVQSMKGKIEISIPAKLRLIVYALWLHRIERWLLWLASHCWVPWWIKRKLRRLARILTRIANHLIWMAFTFCEETPD